MIHLRYLHHNKEINAVEELNIEQPATHPTQRALYYLLNYMVVETPFCALVERHHRETMDAGLTFSDASCTQI